MVVELLSPATEREDLGQTLQKASQPPSKWEVYEQILRVPYYLLFNRYTDDLQAYGLITSRYQPLTLENQCLWMEELQLGLGLWQGTYQEIERLWLRWYDAEGNWLATPTEQERRRVEK